MYSIKEVQQNNILKGDYKMNYAIVIMNVRNGSKTTLYVNGMSLQEAVNRTIKNLLSLSSTHKIIEAREVENKRA